MNLLAHLPAPPPGKSGWPWTEESPASSPDDVWPKITIVTPSYMQCEYLEQTIRSVLLQNYPNLEYFILDAGSTDSSREIIRKYEPWLAGWRSEKDAGQSAAVNEGWARATGEVLAWINSDDWYQPGAFAAIVPLFCGIHPADWVGGLVDDCVPDGTPVRRHPAWPTPLPTALGFHEFGYYQPGMFWSRRLVEKIGPLEKDMHLCFDLDFWARSLVAGFVLTPVDTPVACFRQHSGSKTSSQLEVIIEESREIFRRHSPPLSSPERRQAARWLREYSSDLVLQIVYRRLRQGRRAAALVYLLREFRTGLELRPRRLLLGALARILTKGRPPEWFQS
jgi:glycosyltransferase involved in cell wall biosynthesis